MRNRLVPLVAQFVVLACCYFGIYMNHKMMDLVQKQRVVILQELDALKAQQQALQAQRVTIEILRRRCDPVPAPADPLANGF